MIDPVDRAVRAISRRNSYALVWAQFGIAHLVMLGGLGLLSLYRRMSVQDFLILTAVSQALVAIDNLISIKLTLRMWRPVRRWERGARDQASTVAAWRALATLPIEYLRRVRKYPFGFAYLPFVAFTSWKLGLPWYSFLILAVVGTVVLAYSLIVRYFTIEVVIRPVLEEVARGLPSDFEIDAPGLPLRWRLLAVAPVINVIVATDEMGALAQSFNMMVEGLDERERLRTALGAYVDPGLAERILREGAELDGEELEVTVMFLDVRDFTAFAERAQPTEMVALLNDLWELVVPALLRHGGHANKFFGDGLLAVFGAPDHHDDHAERAVLAALEIAELVRDQYRGRIAVGMGVNSGTVLAGTVGGGGRVEFTVIGDAVNTAARVEAATRETGDDILITDATRRLLPDDGLRWQARAPVPMKGKQIGVALWAPRARTELEVSARAQVGARGRAGAVTVPD